MRDPLKDEDYPGNFYFNGEDMPKWGACWSLAKICKFLEPDVDDDIGHADILQIYGRIDHTGIAESADADTFRYAVLEALHILLSQRDFVFAALAEQSYGKPEDVYEGLVEAALEMHELSLERGHAFWTSGCDEDRIHLIERIRRSRLAANSPEFLLPPHLEHRQRALRSLREERVGRLHKLAQSGQCDKKWRTKLYEIHAA